MIPLLLSLGLTAMPVDPATLSLPNQDQHPVAVKDFKGKYVLVYFYPKDNTPGCTTEAESLRDQYARLTELGIVVLGVSRQGAESHTVFRNERNLPFDLLTDADGSYAAALGIDRIPLIGLHKRQSVLFGRDGKILKRYDSVAPAKHAAEVIAFVEALEQSRTKR